MKQYDYSNLDEEAKQQIQEILDRNNQRQNNNNISEKLSNQEFGFLLIGGKNKKSKKRKNKRRNYKKSRKSNKNKKLKLRK